MSNTPPLGNLKELSLRSRQTDLQRQITAYHEAAHAVMAFRLGLPVELLKVRFSTPSLISKISSSIAPATIGGDRHAAFTFSESFI